MLRMGETKDHFTTLIPEGMRRRLYEPQEITYEVGSSAQEAPVSQHEDRQGKTDEDRQTYDFWLEDYVRCTRSGLSSESKRALVQETLKTDRATIIFLQETKMQTLTEGVARDIWHRRRPSWVEVGAVGSAGGIAILWDSSLVELIEVKYGLYFVAAHFKILESNMQWAALCVWAIIKRPENEFLA
ncbi:hypothetical protein H6P81_003307 [Aristolochia fimbriata]|uniref:Uncharacterized protein n=1 Tax=Aristolochia fimbriata TaxID=158543 RepID=A0AAV7FE29_ARIFI|nr:hypothetical protein H6P81_003307 [Aristolochia fimbriata]